VRFVLLVDNNILSALAKINKLDYLKAISGRVCTTSSVIAELNKAHALGYSFVGKINRIKEYRGGWLKIVSPTIKEISKAESITDKSLSYTDAECIAIAKNRNFIFLTDDRYAAKIALKENVRVWDLVLFLAICIKKGIINSKEELNVVLSELAKKDNYRFTSKDETFLFRLLEKNTSKKKR